MEVKHEAGKDQGTFYIEENGRRIANLLYVYEGEEGMIIEHTIVDPGNEGKGLGKMLVDAAAAFAREEGYKIIPACSYAKKVMGKSDAYKDVLL